MTVVSAQSSSSGEESQCGEMEGECNHCVCCCYRSGLDLMKYKPNDDCECESDFAPAFVMSMGLLATSILVSLFTGCYFAGKLPVSPFKPPPISSTTTGLPTVEMAALQR
eukprot:g2182.t1